MTDTVIEGEIYAPAGKGPLARLDGLRITITSAILQAPEQYGDHWVVAAGVLSTDTSIVRLVDAQHPPTTK